MKHYDWYGNYLELCAAVMLMVTSFYLGVFLAEGKFLTCTGLLIFVFFLFLFVSHYLDWSKKKPKKYLNMPEFPLYQKSKTIWSRAMLRNILVVSFVMIPIGFFSKNV